MNNIIRESCSPESVSERLYFRRRINKTLQLLGLFYPRHVYAFRSYVGWDENPKTMAEIGREIGVSGSRIRDYIRLIRFKIVHCPGSIFHGYFRRED